MTEVVDEGPPNALTWDDLADIYKKATGRTAKVRPMDEIVKWAESRPDLILIDGEGFMFRAQ